MGFYTTVTVIAIVVLILVLTYVGIVMVYYKGKTSFPSVAATCPDYWKVGEENKCYIPSASSRNIGKLYTTYVPTFGEGATGATPTNRIPGYGTDATGNYINFQDEGWAKSGKNQICAQSQWANSQQLVWDGVTNYNGC